MITGDERLIFIFSDSFVNSQEWTLSRSCPTIHLGLLGDSGSPKSTLVHRYLTGQYLVDHSTEGKLLLWNVFVVAKVFFVAKEF